MFARTGQVSRSAASQYKSLFRGAANPLRTACAHGRTDIDLVQVRERPLRRIVPSLAKRPARNSSGSIIVKSDLRLVSKPDVLPLWGVGPLKKPATAMAFNEDIPVGTSHGLQSRLPGEGPFTPPKLGNYGVREDKSLWTVDMRGLNVIFEATAFPTPRGMVVHSNISMMAAAAGEVWFHPDIPLAVTINNGSMRFPMQEPVRYDEHSKLWMLPSEGSAERAQVQAQWDAVARLWIAIGYEVVFQVPLGQRFGDVKPQVFRRPEGLEVSATARKKISRHPDDDVNAAWQESVKKQSLKRECIKKNEDAALRERMAAQTTRTTHAARVTGKRASSYVSTPANGGRAGTNNYLS